MVKKKEIIAYYEAEGKNLKHYDIDKFYRGMSRYFSTHAPRRVVLETWLSTAKPHETFLDVGCNLGYFVRLMAQKGLQATGVDISPTKVRKAKLIAQILKLNCEYSVMDAENLEYEDSSFDWVLCTETLEHILNDSRATDELIRVAKRNIIITVPRRTLFWRLLNRFKPVYGFDVPGAGHLREYTRESILKLFQNSVQVEFVKPCGFVLPFLDRFLSRIPIFQAVLCLKIKKVT